MNERTVKLNPGERIDDLGRRGYRIIQNPDKFCFGIDAVLLAWFASVKEGDRVLDLGTGTGIVPLLLDARNFCGAYTGLEIQADMAEMAGRSVLLNEASDRIKIVEGDLKTASGLFGKAGFDVVTVNPPYMPDQHGLKNPDSGKAIARHEILCDLEDVIREAGLLLKPYGSFFMVHRPGRLPQILEKMRAHKIAPSHLCFVHPFVDKEATMVLVSGKKCGKDVLKVDPPVIVYETPGIYTAKIGEIYGDGRH